MTQRERLIVSAYTGVLMCDFDLVHKYIEEKMGHPVWTHELRFESTHAKIREKIKPDFLELCGNGDKHGAIADIVAEKRRRATATVEGQMKVSDAEMIAAGNALYTAVLHWREYQTHGTCDEKGWARVADAMRNYHEKRMGANCGKMAKAALAASADESEAAK